MGCLQTVTTSVLADWPPRTPTTGRPSTPAPYLSVETSSIYPAGMDMRAAFSTVREALLLGAGRTSRVTGPCSSPSGGEVMS